MKGQQRPTRFIDYTDVNRKANYLEGRVADLLKNKKSIIKSRNQALREKSAYKKRAKKAETELENLQKKYDTLMGDFIIVSKSERKLKQELDLYSKRGEK